MQMCGDCNAARKWINGPQHDEQEAQKHIWRNPLRLVEGGHHVHRGKIEDEVKHMFRAQSVKRQITLQIWEQKGNSRITIEGVKNAEMWIATRGCWDGGNKKVTEAADVAL